MVLVATQVKRRRGTTAENDAFTGAEGEIVVDTERHELRVHDGVTQGGFKIGGGSGALVVGQILEVVGTADYTPEGCLLADGAEYTKAQFPDLWANFLTGTPKLQTCTYTEYADQIAEYGFCNKFAVDTTNETFKVPTRNKYRKLVKKIVNGTTWANLYDDGWCEQGGYVNGETSQTATFPIAMADTNYTIAYGNRSGTYEQVRTNNKTATTIEIRNANNGGTVSTEWQVFGYAPIPDSTSNITREFVVVANGTLNQEQMDWSAWASSLAGKANIDLSNTPANVDYVVESQEPTSANGYTWYRKYKSGWVEQGGYLARGTNGNVTVSFPIEMAEPPKSVFCMLLNNSDTSAVTFQLFQIGSITTTSCSMRRHPSIDKSWEVKGMSAQ